MTPGELLDQDYGELRSLAASKMAREPAGHTLDATGLVNEAWLCLKAQTFTTKGDFLRTAAVRRILVDHARAKRAGKRGGGRRVEFDAGLVADAQPSTRPWTASPRCSHSSPSWCSCATSPA